MSERDTVVALAPAGARKSDIVVGSLLAADEFRKRYDLRVVVDDCSGATLETVRDHDRPWAIAADPGDPTPAVERVASDRPEFLVACGWTHLIPPETIDLAAVAALNCHGSYLPANRGPATHRLHWARADDSGGVTVHYLTESFDDGRILCQEQFDIGLTDTPLDILRRSSRLGAVLLREALLLANDGYEGAPNEGGDYHTLVPWSTVLTAGTANHLLRAAGLDRRMSVSTS